METISVVKGRTTNTITKMIVRRGKEENEWFKEEEEELKKPGGKEGRVK